MFAKLCIEYIVGKWGYWYPNITADHIREVLGRLQVRAMLLPHYHMR